MSDTPQGPEWWQASDAKWYPPPRPDWPPAPADEPPTDESAPAESAPPTETATPAQDATPAEIESSAIPELPPTPEQPAAAPTEVAASTAAPPPMPPPDPTQLAPPTTLSSASMPPSAPAPGAPPGYPVAGMPLGPPTAYDDAVFGPPGTGPSATGDPFGTPAKNRTPLIVGGVIAAVIALVIGFLVLGGGDDGDGDADVAADTTETTDEGPGNKEGEPDSDPDPTVPPASDFPEFVDPADAEPISVDETGFVLVPDEFEEGVTNASYGFVLTNPNDGLAATAIEVTIGLFDDTGVAVETDSAFVSGLLGGQTVGMGGFITDVPAGVVRVDVTAEASQLVREDGIDGELTVTDITTTEEEFGGLTVSFSVSSTFSEKREDLTLYGVFRNAAGLPIGGTQSFLEFVEGGGTSVAELRSFADVPGIASVDVTVTLSSGDFFD